MAGLSLKNINKSYPNGFIAVKDLSLEIEDKEFIVLVGPSGCGKSTTLRMMAGLEEITSGELWMDDKLVNDVEPKDRDVAMIFQNNVMYEELTVYDNLAFGLKLKKTPKSMIDQFVREAAKLMEIEHLLDRRPKALSDAQIQRVALGRAIVRKPKILLMDEPLLNLDKKLREQMRGVILDLHKKTQTTFIYVTDDQKEAMALGSRIVVMKDGICQQIGSPEHLYKNPINMFVAGFIGSPQMNFIDSRLINVEGDFELVCEVDNFKLPKKKATLLLERGYQDKPVILGIRHEDMTSQGMDVEKIYLFDKENGKVIRA